MIGFPVTPEDYARARRTLLRRYPVLANPSDGMGPAASRPPSAPTTFRRRFERSPASRLLQTKAADHDLRPADASPMPAVVTPQSLSALTDDQLRTVGMRSRQKGAYFRDSSARRS